MGSFSKKFQSAGSVISVRMKYPQDDFLRGVNCWIGTLWLKRTVAEEIPFSETAYYQDVIAP